ncbi:MAG: hypothetical protein JW822_08630 [Spirochaetales bacterium]|nr:hypothetical protein [Spirochaetales bacterium]
MSDRQDTSSKTSHNKKFYERPEFIPIIIFIILFFLLIINTSLSGYPPSIEKISRENNIHSFMLKIDGKNFGDKKAGGEVYIEDLALTDSAFLKWTDNQIIVAIPKEIKSGLLYVVTKTGKTNAVIYTNPNETPELFSAMYRSERTPQQTGPNILSVIPLVSKVGEVLTIKGNGFGREQGKSLVFFTWKTQTKNPDVAEDSLPVVSAKKNDFDYISWDDKEIKVKIPDGATSGNIYVYSENGNSNQKYLEIQYPSGNKHYHNRNKYSIKYSIYIKTLNSESNNGLYLWIPKIIEEAEQREISYIQNRSRFGPLFDYKRVMLFYLDELKNGDQHEITLEYIFDRYAVTTEIDAGTITAAYDKESEFYLHYTGENDYLKPELAEMKQLSAELKGNQDNPYLTAKKIYEYIIENMSFCYLNPYQYRTWRLSPDSIQGDSFMYAILFCTLCRSAGIPARPVAGFLIDNKKSSIRHFWAEFYLPNVGWIPVDPFLADNSRYKDFPSPENAKSYYFGNLDNRHITWSKGFINLRKITPNGRAVYKAGLPNLQSIHEEITGNLHEYSIFWRDVKVLGIF